MQETEKSFWDHIVSNIEYGFTTYRDFIFGFLMGLFIAWIYHRFIGNYYLKQSYKVLLNAKEETIQAYKELISERLGKLKVEQQDSGFFKKIKRFFRKNNS